MTSWFFATLGVLILCAVYPAQFMLGVENVIDPYYGLALLAFSLGISYFKNGIETAPPSQSPWKRIFRLWHPEDFGPYQEILIITKPVNGKLFLSLSIPLSVLVLILLEFPSSLLSEDFISLLRKTDDYLGFIGNSVPGIKNLSQSLTEKYHEYAGPIIRAGIAIQLVFLGFASTLLIRNRKLFATNINKCIFDKNNNYISKIVNFINEYTIFYLAIFCFSSHYLTFGFGLNDSIYTYQIANYLYVLLYFILIGAFYYSLSMLIFVMSSIL